MSDRMLRERFPTCREIVELVTDYLEDRLDPDARERFERHIATCDACETYLDQIRLTIAATGSLRDDELPAATRDGLVAAFRDLFPR
jgi:anti-sigma factor RsiW